MAGTFTKFDWIKSVIIEKVETQNINYKHTVIQDTYV